MIAGRTVNTALIGLGNVGRNFLRILEGKGRRLEEQYGLSFRIVCVADSSGVAVNLDGFDPAMLRLHKENGGARPTCRLLQGGDTGGGTGHPAL